jgi:hypothetical protein
MYKICIVLFASFEIPSVSLCQRSLSFLKVNNHNNKKQKTMYSWPFYSAVTILAVRESLCRGNSVHKDHSKMWCLIIVFGAINKWYL